MTTEQDKQRLACYRDFIAIDHGVTAPDVAFFLRLIDERDERIARLEGAWEPPETIPRDGSEIRIRLDCSRGVPAYWDAELKTFVLSRPLHMESISQPSGWAALSPAGDNSRSGTGDAG